MYDSILLPTDAGKGAERATDHAIELATAHDADLHVLYVVDSDVYASYTGDEYVHELEGLESALEQEGEDALEAATERATEAGLTITTAVRHGTPDEEIIAHADHEDVDLIVMGSKDRPGEYRRLLGSVTERVVRLSSRPVTVVKTPVEE